MKKQPPRFATGSDPDSNSLFQRPAEDAHRCNKSLQANSDAPKRLDTPRALPPDTLRRLYTIAEISEALHLSDSTIRRAIRLKHLAAIKVGRVVRLAGADVEAWLDRSRRKAR